MTATQIIATATASTAAGAIAVALWKIAAAWTATNAKLDRVADLFQEHIEEHRKERQTYGRY